MSGPDKPKSNGPFSVPDDFFPQDLATENTAVTVPEGHGYSPGDQRPPAQYDAEEPVTPAAEVPPPTPAPAPEPPPVATAPTPAPENSGLVVEIGEEAAPPVVEDDDPGEDTSTQVMMWVALGVIGSTVGLVGAAILFFGYTALTTPDEVVKETVDVEKVGGVKVRKGLKGAPVPPRHAPAADGTRPQVDPADEPPSPDDAPPEAPPVEEPAPEAP